MVYLLVLAEDSIQVRLYMDILVVGNPDSHVEFKSKFQSKHSVSFKSCYEIDSEDVMAAEIIFDFEVTEHPQHGEIYHKNPQAVLMLNSVKTTLVELVNSNLWKHVVVGFNGFPSMFNRPLLELTDQDKTQSTIQEICKRLDSEYRIVEDRVGMVTPRVVCMIINEAFFTYQEGTAGEEDIDLAMKLGTNYPAGPFEMAKTIGLNHIYELLEALRQSTGDERYKVCPLLKKRYLAEQ
jgi:3-hydroxybutyryl-CoA dehydrogenase